MAHYIKEIDIKRYSDDLQILATRKSAEIYRYSNAILKYMLKDALKIFIKTLLNSKDDVQVFHGCNRCPHNNDNTSLGTDDNLSNRPAKLKNSAKAFIHIGLVNLPLKLDTKIF